MCFENTFSADYSIVVLTCNGSVTDNLFRFAEYIRLSVARPQLYLFKSFILGLVANFSECQLLKLAPVPNLLP